MLTASVVAKAPRSDKYVGDERGWDRESVRKDVSNAKNRRSRSRERVVACYRKYHISRLCKKECSGIVSKFWDWQAKL